VRDLLDGISDLGADAVAGEESGADRGGNGGGEGPRVCEEAPSEGSSQELKSHAGPLALSHAHSKKRKPNCYYNQKKRKQCISATGCIENR